MSASKLDAVYRSIVITKFFTKGWGKPENLRRLFKFRKIISNRDECFKLISSDYPVTITKEETWSDCHVLEGHFMSPLDTYLPGIVPECAKKAHFQVLLPLKWRSENFKPMCLHLAGTGDHFFWRRRNLVAKPLLKEAGIGSIILENPFYGSRKPIDQVRSCLHNVSDIFVMGGCLMLESLVLFHWCERNGLGPLGVTGLSMGGHMASLAATNWPKPLVLVPCLSWSTASPVFTQGVMSNSINWELLRSQYFSDGEYSENLSKMVTIVDEAFLAGKQFAKTLTDKDQTINKTKEDCNLNTIGLKNNGHVNDVTNITKKLMDYESNKHVLNKIGSGMKMTSEKSAPLETLKLSNKISDSLYQKITSGKRFELSMEEINELNELNINDLETSFGFINQSKSVEELPLTDATPITLESKLINSITDVEVDEIFRASVLKQIFNGKIENLKMYNSDVNKNILFSGENEKGHNLKKTETDAADKGLIPANKNEKLLKVGTPRNISDITMEILGSIPLLLSKGKHSNEKESNANIRDREALQFMRGVMDECTHLSNFSVPFDTSLIIAVCAKNDAYVPQDGCRSLEEVWPGAEVRYIDAGHVSAYVLHQKLFRSSIVDAFERSKKKWIDATKYK